MPEWAINIKIDRLLFYLFCAYAFSMPYELILEYALDIDTVFKPFRTLSLLIIGVYVIRCFKQGLEINMSEKADWFLYGIILYGLIVSAYRMITEIFNMGLFMNDIFQTGLHVATFFVFKQMPFTKEQGRKILHWFIGGILGNCVYIYFLYFGLGRLGRQPGFTDNPNYVAFGIVIAMSYVLLRMNQISKPWALVGHGLLAFLLFTVFNVEASRTGLIMLLFILLPIFLFSTIYRKFLVICFAGIIGFILLSGRISMEFGDSAPTLLVERLERSLEGEEDVRMPVWRGVFRVLEDRGYAGLGIGQFKANFSEYYGNEPNVLIMNMVNRGYYMSPHNDMLAILADYGAPGLIFFLIFIILTIQRHIQKLVLKQESANERLMSRFKITAFLCIIIFGLTAENFMHQMFWFTMMFTTKEFS